MAGLDAFLAGFGPGLVNTLDMMQRRRAEQQRMQMESALFGEKMRQVQTEREAANLFGKGLTELAGMQGTPSLDMPSGPISSGQSLGGGLAAGGALTQRDPRGLIPYIRETAQKYGIDPGVAVRVAASEGLANPVGDGGKSGGAFQLYTGGGEGNRFQQETGLSPLDSNNERQTIDFALRRASQVGWGPWHGAAKAGIAPWQGITRTAGGAAPKTQRVPGGKLVSEDDFPYQTQPGGMNEPALAGGGGPAQPPAAAGQSEAQAAPAAAPDLGPYRAGLSAPSGAGAAGGLATPKIDPIQPLAQAAPPETHQQSQGITRQVGQMIPPQAFGMVGLTQMARAIDRVAPNADPLAKMMAIERLQKLLEPQQRMAWDVWKAEYLRKPEAVQTPSGMQWVRPGEPFPAGATKASATQKVFMDPSGNLHWLPEGQTIPPGWRQAPTAGAQKPQNIEYHDDSGKVKRGTATWTGQGWELADGTPITDPNAKIVGAGQPRSPQAIIMQQAREEHPEWTSAELEKFQENNILNQSVMRAFGGGMIGRNVIALNTVADHILRVEDYAKALQNGQIPRANQIANALAKEMGKPEVTTFEAGRDIMADEVVRLLTSTGGTEADRVGMQGRLSTMMSPEQFAGVFGVLKDMTGARFSALEQQFAGGDQQRTEQFKTRFLTPAARKAYEFLTQPGEQQPPLAAGAGAPRGDTMPLPAAFAADPDGTGYRKDGAVWVKRGNQLVKTPGAAATPPAATTPEQ